MEEILGVATHTMWDEDSRHTVAQRTWSADIQIFSLITGEFGIEPDDEVVEAKTTTDLLRALQSRGAFRE
jgi:hypothetical protein